MTDVEVVEELVVSVTVEREVEVSVVVTTAVTVDVLEKVSVMAAPVVVVVVTVSSLEVMVIGDAVTVLTGVDFSMTMMMSGESFCVVVEVGIGVLAGVLALWVRHWTEVTSLELNVSVNERAWADSASIGVRKHTVRIITRAELGIKRRR